jgi:hypothetical protein
MYEITDAEDAALLGITPLSDAYAKMAKVENAIFDLTTRLATRDAAVEAFETRLAEIEAITKSWSAKP